MEVSSPWKRPSLEPGLFSVRGQIDPKQAEQSHPSGTGATRTPVWKLLPSKQVELLTVLAADKRRCGGASSDLMEAHDDLHPPSVGGIVSLGESKLVKETED